jgi:hypothetical protein
MYVKIINLDSAGYVKEYAIKYEIDLLEAIV